jgi:hypothetical protein
MTVWSDAAARDTLGTEQRQYEQALIDVVSLKLIQLVWVARRYRRRDRDRRDARGGRGVRYRAVAQVQRSPCSTPWPAERLSAPQSSLASGKAQSPDRRAAARSTR